MKHLWLIVLLAGCVATDRPWEIPWPRDPVPYAPPPPLQVREGRYPIDLPTVLRLSGANSLDVAYVREKLRETYARSQMADERFWPMIEPELTVRRHEGETQGTDGTFVDVDKQQAFTGGRARVTWEAGEALFASLAAARRYDAGRSTLDAAERDVALEAAVAYYDLVRERLRARVAEQSTAVSEKLAAELEVSVAAGRGFRGDVLRARVQSSGGRLQLLRAQESIQLATIRLRSLLRLPSTIELVPSEEVPVALVLVPSGAREPELLQEALGRRDEVQEALSEVAASRHDLSGATWGPLIPRVQAEAAFGQLGSVPSRAEATESYALTVGWRIGPGGLFDPGRQVLVEARLRQAEIHLERVRQRVADQVLAALAQARAKEEQRRLAEQAAKDAEEALALNLRRQSENIGLPLEALQAEESLARARMDLYAAMVEHNQAQLRLFRALGRRHPP
jgi:outer membrane protein TolC